MLRGGAVFEGGDFLREALKEKGVFLPGEEPEMGEPEAGEKEDETQEGAQ